MNHVIFFTMCLLGLFSVSSAGAADRPVLRLLSDRTEAYLKPIIAAFEEKEKVKVEAVFMDQGLLTRLETRPSEADVIVTKDAELLAIAKKRNLLRKIESKSVLRDVPKEFRDSDNYYFVDSYRARVIFYSKARVKPEELSTYEDLASPKWKKRICIRSGMHEYNIALFGSFMAIYGPERASRLIRGIKANLARVPKGNDREQARGIYEGRCDIALMNSYYYPLMAANPDQKAWADAVQVFFPDQESGGSVIMRSGVGVAKGSSQYGLGIKFLEFIAGTDGQKILADPIYLYPVNRNVSRHPLTKTLGAGQKGITDGVFKGNFISLDEVSGTRDAVIKLLNEIRFDQEP